MRWDDLFDDLEADLDSMHRSERDAQIADATRVRSGQIRWVELCRGGRVGLRVAGVGMLHGTVDTVTGAWLLLHGGAGVDWVVGLEAVLGVVDPPTTAARAAGGEVAARMTWLHAWSALSRDRDHVHVVRTDGSTVSGVPGRVGKDFVELGGEYVPYAAIAAVRCPS